MSYVVAAPEFVVAAAHDLATIGSNLSMANAAAVFPTSGVMAAGADEVSATIAALFGAHAQAYQALSAQAALFHQQFVQLMSHGAGEYALTEAANASPLNTVQQGALSATPAASATAAMPGATTVPAAPPPAVAAMTRVSPAAGIPVTPAALTTASAPAAAMPAAAAPSLGGMAPMAVASGTPIGATAAAAAEPVAAPVQAGTAEFAPAPASTLPLAAGTPLAAAPASRAYTPATPAYSPAPAAAAEEQPA